MKTKIIKDRKSGARTLVVKPTKREQLEYDQAEWLLGRPSNYMAEFRYRMQDGDAELYYDVTDMLDLKSYLKAPLGSAQYLGILSALDEVLETCTKMGYPLSAVQCDVESVFVRPDGRPSFIFVPLSGTPTQWSSSPIALLQYLGDVRHMAFVVAEDARRAEALFDYAQRNRVLSLTSYRRFLEDEFNRAPARDADPGTAETPRSIGAVKGQSAPRMAFDPVSLLAHAPSATDVVANQSFSDRIRGGVGEISPTAAPAAMKRYPGKCAEETRGAGDGATPEAPARASAEQAITQPTKDAASAGIAPEPAQAPAAASATPAFVGGTALLGSVASQIAIAVKTEQARSRPAEARAYLERADGALRYPLDGNDALTMGRSSTCDIVVSGNTNISRKHAVIKRTGDMFEVTDLGSSNGTFFKENRLSAGQCARIRIGDTFRLADEPFVLVAEPVEA